MLADDPGLGKTRQAILAADRLGMTNILVLCQGIGRDTWKREIERWQETKRSISIIRGVGEPEPTDVVIVGYGPALQTFNVLSPLMKRRWDLMIIDECQAEKNPNSLMTQLTYGSKCDAKKGLAAHADVVWALSGTPFPNGIHEAWTHARALFPQACVNLERYDDWFNRFCYYRKTKFGKQVLNAMNESEFITRYRPYILRRKQEDVLSDLPPLRFGHVVVAPDRVPPMPEEAVEAQNILRAALASLGTNPTPEQVQATLSVMSMHIATLLRWTGIAKAPAVAESIKADMDGGVEKMLVFARHKDVFRVLLAKLPGSKAITGDTPSKERDHLIDVFQGRVPGETLRCLLCSMQVAATTLTLTAAHTVAIVESGWVPDAILQAVKRTHRIGQTMPVLAKLYSLAGSVDEETDEVIMRKYLTMKRVNSHFERAA